MIKLIVFFLVCISSLKAQTIELTTMPNWTNLVEKYNLVGDGITDNSDNFQKAINELKYEWAGKNLQNSNTLFFPKGVYCISKTVALKNQIGCNIIGENPLTTYIKWTGGNDDTCLLISSSAYIKVSRLSFIKEDQTGVDALASRFLKVTLTDTARSWAPTSMEFSDLIFTGNWKRGLGCGSVAGEGSSPDEPGTGNMDSEFEIKRCVFNGCEIGLDIRGYNALDYWVWDCKFSNCTFGVHNTFGNYHLYKCWFENNSYSDIECNRTGYYTSVRYCTSINANYFHSDGGFSSNTFKRIFQGNKVYNAKAQYPIYFGHIGGVELIDNEFYYLKGDVMIYVGILPDGYNILSYNNIYPKKNPYYVPNGTEIFSFQDKVSSVKKRIPSYVPNVYVQSTTPIVTMNKAINLQDVINGLDYSNGKKYIVYFPTDNYKIENKITFPKNANIDIVGDGLVYGTSISTTYDFKDSCMFEIVHPSKVNFYDVEIASNKAPLGIRYKVPNNISFLNNQQYGVVAPDTTLYLDANIKYIKTSSFFTQNSYVANTKNYFSFGGQYAGLHINKATATSLDCWFEGKDYKLKGNGTMLLSSGMSYPTNQSVDFKDLTGNLYFTNFRVGGKLMDDSTKYKLNLFLWNVNFLENQNPSTNKNFTNYTSISISKENALDEFGKPTTYLNSIQPLKNIIKPTTTNKQIREYYLLMKKAGAEINNMNQKFDYTLSRLTTTGFKIAIKITN